MTLKKKVIVAAVVGILGATGLFLKNSQKQITQLRGEQITLQREGELTEAEYKRDKKAKQAARKLLQIRERRKIIAKQLQNISVERQLISDLEESIQNYDYELTRDQLELDSYWPLQFNSFENGIDHIKELIEKFKNNPPANRMKINADKYLIQEEIRELQASIDVLHRQAMDTVEIISRRVNTIRLPINKVLSIDDPALKDLQDNLRAFL